MSITQTAMQSLHPLEIKSRDDKSLSVPRECKWDRYLAAQQVRTQLLTTNFEYISGLNYSAVKMLYHRAFSPRRSFLRRNPVASFWVAYTRALLRSAQRIPELQQSYFDAVVEAELHKGLRFQKRTIFLQYLCNSNEDLRELSEQEEAKWVERVDLAKKREGSSPAITCSPIAEKLRAQKPQMYFSERTEFWEKMLELRDDVYAGEHPKIKLPEEIRVQELRRLTLNGEMAGAQEDARRDKKRKRSRASEGGEEDFSDIFKEALAICADQDILWSGNNAIHMLDE